MGQPERIPSKEGIRAAFTALPIHHEGTNLTDRLGLAGVCLVFPELRPVAPDMQLLMTLAHGIDHVHDEGDNFKRITTGPTNLQNLNHLYRAFYDKFGEDNASHDNYQNTMGFLSQAGKIERKAHNYPPQTKTGIQSYRELINAIYVRMIVSFGSDLISSGDSLDTIGIIGAEKSPDELMELYTPFINGKELNELPNGDRSHALFLWTMLVQEQFDLISQSDNAIKMTPSLSENNSEYKQKAIEQGVRPVFIGAARIGLSAALRSKRALRVLPRYKNEREILKLPTLGE